MAKHPLQSMIEEAGYECQSYSGRAMYGKRCLAVVLDAGKLGRLVSDLMDACLMSDPEGGDEYDAMTKAARDIRDMRWDNMGFDMVYYWPDVPYTDEDDDNYVGQAHQPEREDGA